MRDRLGRKRCAWVLAAWGMAWAWLGASTPGTAGAAPPGVTREDVEQSIKAGIGFLLKQQRPEGGWGGHPGESALVTLALLTAGEPADSEPIRRGLAGLRNATINPAHATYSYSLMTMALATADPVKYRDEIARNAEWLEQAQTRTGAWSYSAAGGHGGGDNSNTQYALLGLHAASEAGFPIHPDVWLRARRYWEMTQNGDGGWGYQAGGGNPTGSMTCAGVSSLIITGLKRVQGREVLIGDRVERCGEEGVNLSLQRGIDWLSTHFDVRQNPGMGQQWLYYYLYGLERVGRLSGRRFFASGGRGRGNRAIWSPPASRSCSCPKGGRRS